MLLHRHQLLRTQSPLAASALSPRTGAKGIHRLQRLLPFLPTIPLTFSFPLVMMPMPTMMSLPDQRNLVHDLHTHQLDLRNGHVRIMLVHVVARPLAPGAGQLRQRLGQGVRRRVGREGLEGPVGVQQGVYEDAVWLNVLCEDFLGGGTSGGVLVILVLVDVDVDVDVAEGAPEEGLGVAGGLAVADLDRVGVACWHDCEG